jgi:hypothetical protein
MNANNIDHAITGGHTAIANCFAVDGLVYRYAPDVGELTWISERDDDLHRAMVRRLSDLGQAYSTTDELQQVLAHHPTLAAHIDTILMYL